MVDARAEYGTCWSHTLKGEYWGIETHNLRIANLWERADNIYKAQISKRASNRGGRRFKGNPEEADPIRANGEFDPRHQCNVPPAEERRT